MIILFRNKTKNLFGMFSKEILRIIQDLYIIVKGDGKRIFLEKVVETDIVP